MIELLASRCVYGGIVLQCKCTHHKYNLALVLPYPLPFSLPSALPSLCIINELFTIARYKLGQLHKCWRFHTPSHLLPFRAVVDHPSLQKKSSPIHKRNSMSASTCEIVQRLYYVLFRATFRTGLRTKSKVLVRRNYDRTTITVRERIIGSYCIILESAHGCLTL